MCIQPEHHDERNDMNHRWMAALAAALTLGLSGCEIGQGARSSKSVARDIQRAAEGICGTSRDAGPHQGVLNIMLMDGRTDDGIATCWDGYSEAFDA